MTAPGGAGLTEPHDKTARRVGAVDALPDAAAILPRAGTENFSVAGLALGRETRRHLLAIYGFARLVDQLGDEVAGDRPALLDTLEREVDRVYDGEPEHPLMRTLQATVRACGMPRGPFDRLIEANRRDQLDVDYATFDELRGYCRLSADPVGELVLYVFGVATPERIERSDEICTALQLAEHWQDVAEDAGRGRVYLPRDDRERFGVTRAELTAPHASPALRDLLRFEVDRARALLDSGASLVGTLGGRARLAVAGYVAGGRAALDAIAAAGFDVLPGAPLPSKGRRAALALRTLAAGR
jgi:squalene synthase HpnC